MEEAGRQEGRWPGGGVGEGTIINVSASLDAELSQMLSTLTGPQLARMEEGARLQRYRGTDSRRPLSQDIFLEAYGSH